MSTATRLEDIFPISGRSYSTGSEWFDGLLIGLATMLLIRNVELVIIDTLTFIFGNRKQGIGFRVLRVWQMLTMNNIYNLLTGFDSDIPYFRFGSSRYGRGSRVPTLLRRRIRKGNFAGFLFISVLLGKLLVLGAEVAIIAFVIPVAKVHNSGGGLSIKWKNTTITEASLSEMDTCQRLITSEILTDSAQIALCKRVDIQDLSTPVPQKWIPNGSLRLEEVVLTPEIIRKAGGTLDENQNVLCEGKQDGALSSAVGIRSLEMNRQASFDSDPEAEVTNNIKHGEIEVSGNTIKSRGGRFFLGSAAIQPIFSDAHRTLRLAFTRILLSNKPVSGGKKVLTLNGKLLVSDIGASLPGVHFRNFCTVAIDEIQRVTGTLHPELIVDILRSGLTAVAADKFSEPSPDLNAISNVSSFEIGTSRKFRIEPEWMGLAALISILLSAVTSHLNKTEQRMARVYREHNNMWGACSPAFLDEENVAESALFQRGNEYHWGESPGEDWEEQSAIDFSKDVTLT